MSSTVNTPASAPNYLPNAKRPDEYMHIRFLDLSVTDLDERRAFHEALDQVMNHGTIILGPEVAQFEGRIADMIKRKYGIGVNSGTDALVLSIRCLGLGPGDEVILPPLSFIATANAVRLSGATPVFADIQDDLNVDLASLPKLLTPRTRAIVAVHWAGKMCDIEAIAEFARANNLFLIEDCAQAFGASRHGHPAGSWGDLSCYSMNSMKGLASLGEAGMVVTDNEEYRDRLVAMRYNGLVNREFCHFVSSNGRLDTLQAAFLLNRLETYDSVVTRRRDNAMYYDRELGGIVKCPLQDEGCRDVYYTYTIQTEHRDALRAYLEAHGIETRIQHDPLMPRQPAYAEGVRGHFENAERLITRVLCLPANEKITAAEREFVARKVKDFFTQVAR